MYITPLSFTNGQNYLKRNSIKKQQNVQQNVQQGVQQSIRLNFAPSFCGLNDLKNSFQLASIQATGKTVEGLSSQEAAMEKLDKLGPTYREICEHTIFASGLHDIGDKEFKYFLDTIPEAFKGRLLNDKALSRLTSVDWETPFSSREPLLTVDQMRRYFALAPDVFNQEMAEADCTFMHLSYFSSLEPTEALFEFAPEIAKRTMLQRDKKGNTPLHTSILCSASDVYATHNVYPEHVYPEPDDYTIEFNKKVFIDKLNLFAKYARDEFAQALTMKNNDGQNPLHILLQHTYRYEEKHGDRFGFEGTDASIRIKQALGLMNWVAKDELKYALSDVDNNGDLPHFKRISSSFLAEDLKALIEYVPDEAVNMLLQKPSDGYDINLRNIDKKYQREIINTLKEHAPQIFDRLCFMDDEEGRPILCRYVDEKNTLMLEAMQECMSKARFLEATNRPYDENSTIKQKIMSL